VKYWFSQLTALAAGLLFGIGLLVSGMHNPAKVRGFLDLFGDWQPELIAVMGSAVPVFGLIYWWSGKRTAPLFDQVFHKPSLTGIDFRLISGAVLFGIGWGLVGLCPGPLLVDLASFDSSILLFAVALFGGNRLAHWLIGPAHR